MNRLFLSPANWLMSLLVKRTILCLIILCCIGTAILLSNTLSLSNRLIESRSLTNARSQANFIVNAFQLYNDEFILHTQKIKSLRDKSENYIPEKIDSPGSYLLQLSNRIAADQGDLFINVYSDYPWPSGQSQNDGLDTTFKKNTFEKEAFNYLQGHPENNQFYRTEFLNDRYTFRYAQSLTMETSCLNCHNTDPKSPKKDWNVGDVRGILEITTSIHDINAIALQGQRETFLTLISLSFLLIFGLSIVRARLRETTKDLEKQIRERTTNLAEANEDLEQRNILIRQIFGRYLSDEIVDNLLQSPNSLSMGGERRRITILTSDLRGFTAISERLAAEEVITVLNVYLEKMADIINQYEGTINEIMGDGMLVLFGAPTEKEDDAEKAIACAVAMQLAMTEINKRLNKLGFPTLEMGIGINTGLVILGNIGSEKRTKYGVVGSQVNLTYRIESYSLGGEVLLAESTMNECSSLIRVRGQKQVRAKGVKEAITIYQLEGIEGNYNLFLPKQEETFYSLSNPINIQYQILEEKHLELTVFWGQLTELSRRGAKVVIAESVKPSPFTNLKLNLCDNSQISDDIYAKVSEQESSSDSFYIHFTSKIKELEELITTTFQNLE